MLDDEVPTIKNPSRKTRGIIYMDGLVSTGNKFPYTILKRIFPNQKKFPKNFIHILFIAVDKHDQSMMIIVIIY